MLPSVGVELLGEWHGFSKHRVDCQVKSNVADQSGLLSAQAYAHLSGKMLVDLSGVALGFASSKVNGLHP